MRRKLTAAIFTVSTLTSGLVNALGLGEATVKSALNQPLNAEIELLSVDDLTEREIITALASREEFLRSSVERTYFLSDLRFKVEKSPSGKSVIRITSARPVREPFLNFLVEVTWPTGRLLREYALLIDPPTFNEEGPAPVAQAPVASGTQTAPAQASGTTTRVPATPVSGSRTPVSEYGPTDRNDTLWSIAMQTRPDSSVSPQQMMIAIQRMNPDAFMDGNINRLKAGQVLRIPSADEARGTPAREAIAAVSDQNRQFAEANRPAGLDARPGDTGAPVASRPTARRDELRIVVDTQTEQERPSAAVSGAAAGGAGDARAAVAMEQLDKSEREKAELQGRVEDLEDQLETLQRLLALKDDQLAALQAQTDDAAMPEMPEGMSGTMESGGEMPSTDMTEDMTEAPAPDVVAPEVAGQTPEISAPGESVEPEMPAEAPAPVAGSDSGFVEEKPTIKTPEIRQEAPKEESWVEVLKNNTAYQIALGAGGVVLLLILWMLSRNAARRENEYLEKQGAVDRDDGGDDLVTGLAFGDDEDDGETRAVASSPDDEGDPIAEAEVYITYQRWDQAAKVLQEALEKDPDNQQARLKLLEVAGENKDKALFGATAAALLALNNDDLRAEVEGLQARYENDLEDSLLSLDELESQLMAPSAAKPEPKPEPEVESALEDEDNLDIDFDLGEIDLDEKTDVDSLEDAGDSLVDSLDEPEIDTDDLDVGFSEPALDEHDDSLVSRVEDSIEVELEDEALDELDASLEQGLDADFDLGAVEEAADEPVDLGLEESGGFELSDELTALDEDAPVIEEKPKAEDEDLSLELDDADLDLDADLNTDDSDLDLDNLPDDADLSGTLAELDSEISQFAENLDDEAAPAEDLADIAEEPEAVASDVAEDADLDLELDTDVEDLGSGELAEAAATAASADVDDDFVEDLEEDFEFLAGTDEAATKLDLARAYIEMGDKDGARDILEEVAEEGSDEQKQEARNLLEGL